MHVTIPSYEEMTKLRIAAKYYAKVTDYTLINEAICSDDGEFHGEYWTKDSHSSGGAVYCTPNWDEATVVTYATEEWIGVRPILEGASISNFTKDEDDAHVTFYLEYPQDAAPGLLQQELEAAYIANILKSEELPINDTLTAEISINPNHIVYYYKGKKYVREVVKLETTLPNGETYEKGEIVWIEIKPIKWVRLDNNRLLSDKILFTGVKFDVNNSYNGDFSKTLMHKYLNEYFLEDIKHFSNVETKDKSISKLPEKVNPYNFNFDKVSEEEIIKGALLSDIPVFLHGASGDGKSQRVKQFDEDATIIYLRNSSMESFNGKSVYNSNTGEMIDVMPSWLKKVYEKCEKEPDKLHIVFFDEINNASNVIQGMAFNVVLNKEVNGIWKLPENARIVAAGNETKDSLSAEELSEPLFNRFAHVYINTTTESWLKWASTPNENYERLDNTKVINEYKIHPSIYAYISYKSYMKKPVLRTKYNGVTPNADPRKWEMASKVLYATGKPDMLRSLVGKELANDFMKFTKKEVITVEDVINHNYDINSINEMNISEKYNLAVGLSVVDKENLEIVRDFVYNVGKEIGATFDTLWAHGNEDRLEYLLEIGGKKQELDFTFLDGENLDKIEPLKNRGLEAHATDFAICLGQRQDYNLIVRGDYWTLTNAGIRKCYGKPEDYIKVILNTGKVETTFITNSKIGARPVLIDVSNYDLSQLMTDQYVTNDGLKFVTLGEYPQTVLTKSFQNKFENLYKNNELALTYNYYTIYNKNLKKCKLPEYIYEGKKYVRVNPNFSNERYSLATLSDGKDYSGNYPIWIEVEPIKWFVFENENKQSCLLSRDILFSGVPFSTKKIYDEDFKNTFIKKFMDEEFSKDILRGQTFAKNDQNVKVLKK